MLHKSPYISTALRSDKVLAYSVVLLTGLESSSLFARTVGLVLARAAVVAGVAHDNVTAQVESRGVRVLELEHGVAKLGHVTVRLVIRDKVDSIVGAASGENSVLQEVRVRVVLVAVDGAVGDGELEANNWRADAYTEEERRSNAHSFACVFSTERSISVGIKREVELADTVRRAAVDRSGHVGALGNVVVRGRVLAVKLDSVSVSGRDDTVGGERSLEVVREGDTVVVKLGEERRCD
jgi:hypothetical protein